MTFKPNLADLSISISTSESPDMEVLGLSREHLQDAMAEIARHLLALGAKIQYGGDLRANGFTELLFELVARHRRDAEEAANGVSVLNFLAWPVHIKLTNEELHGFASELEGSAGLVLLDLEGKSIALDEREYDAQIAPTEDQWSNGLTAMRQFMSDNTDARIILGGRVERFMGAMPGIAEEALISLKSEKPLFVIGGFGGCARAISESIGLAPRWEAFPLEWIRRGDFGRYSAKDLNNGLSETENAALAQTPHIDQAITLILTGLFRLKDSAKGKVVD